MPSIFSFHLSLYVMLVLLFLSISQPAKQVSKKVEVKVSNLKMYWIDVDGGAATLIVTPMGESILIDSGNPGGRDADAIYEVAVKEAGLKKIDHLVTTHWHQDHYGGAPELALKMPIIEVIEKEMPDKLPEDNAFAEHIKAYRAMQVQKRTLIKPNTTITLNALHKSLPELKFRFVGVDKQFFTAASKIADGLFCDSVPDKAMDTSDNANSMVMVMDYGAFRFFDGADLTWNIEKNLVCPKDLIGAVDVYQVNHHGMDQSNNPVLVKNLAPTVTVMNNGPMKGCGAETIKTLQQVPTIKAAYQLHKNIRADSIYNAPSNYIANIKKDCKRNFISLEVASDGKSYTVRIPATGHQQTFTTKTL